MSFIERAVEQLQREGGAVPKLEQRPEPATSQASHLPAANPANASGQSLPCRDDRRLTVDRPKLRAAGVIAPESEERRLGEEYRLIKRPLLSALARDDAPPSSNIIVVTSAVPGEGKTFTSINLALSLALERNREVVLVDGDVAKRDITRLFGLDHEPGLLDAAGPEGPGLADALFRTDIPSLYVLPAGRQHIEATEILASENMATLLASLASEPRRIVLVDSPPLLVTSEAGVLASLAGQVVVVVKASETPQEIVLRAVESLAEEKSVGLVLNQAISVPERAYGHYGYYGDYGYSRNRIDSDAPGTEKLD